MADGLGDIFVGLDDFRKFSADQFLQNANRLIGDTWTNHALDALPGMAGDIWTQHVTSQLPDLMSMLNPPAPPPPAPTQSPLAAPTATSSPDLAPSTTSAFPTTSAPSSGAEVGTSPPAAPPPAATAPTSSGEGGGGGGGLVDVARQAAQRFGIDPDIFVRQIQQESGFRPDAKSPAGAIGVAQFMPGTAQGLGVDPTDPVASLYGAARLMADHLKRYGGDMAKALAAYNAGPGNVDKYGGVPPFEETQRYVSTILGGAGQAVQQAASTATGAIQDAADKAGALATQAGATGQQWVDMAKSFLGKPYIWGSGSGAGGRGTQDVDPQTGLPRGFDCSGFVSYILKNGLGIDLPAQTSAAYGSGKLDQVDASQAQPGDVVFYNMGTPDPTRQHMALYLGNGKIIEAGGVEHDVNVADVNAVGPPTFMRPKDGVPQAAQAALSGAGAVAQPGPSTFGQTTQPATAAASQGAFGLGSIFPNLFGGGGGPTPPTPPGGPQQQQQQQQPQKSVWDQLGEGISSVFKSVFGAGGGPSTPPLPPEGGGYGAVPAGGVNPLDQLETLAQRGQQNLAMRGVDLNAPMPLPPTPLSDQPRSLAAAGIDLNAGPSLPPTAPDLLSSASANVPQSIPVVSGLLSGGLGAAAGFLSQPSATEAAQTSTEIEQKYGGGLQPKPGGGFTFKAPDYSNITPEDQQALANATMAVGGVAAPLGPEAEPPAVAGNINLAKYPPEVQDVIQAAAPTIPESATRGVVPDAVVRDLAQKAGTSVPDIVARWQPGQAQNAETLYALRDALANQGQQVLEAQRTLRANPDSADAQAALVQALTEHRAVQEVVQGTTAEAGRALRQFTQPVTGDIAALQQLQNLAAKTGQSPADLAKQLADMDLSDPVHMADIANALNPPRLPPGENLPTGPQTGQLHLFEPSTPVEQRLQAPGVGPFEPAVLPTPADIQDRGLLARSRGELGPPLQGPFETPNVPTPAQTPEQADYLRRAMTYRALTEGTPLPEIPYQGPRPANLLNAPEGPPSAPPGGQPHLFESGTPVEQPMQPATAGNFEPPNVPTPPQTPEQADYLRRALVLKALREGTSLPDIPYQGPTPRNLQAPLDPSRAFDYDALAEMRQAYETQQPQMDLNAPPKPNRVDQIISYTVNNMLSGVGTQVQNIMGNLSATVSRPLVTAAGGLTGDVGMLTDAARDVAAMGATFSEAFSRAGRTLQTGVRSGQPEQMATSVFAPQLRLLAAGDEFFRTLNAAGGQATEMSRLLRENPSLSFDEVLAKYRGRLLAAGEDAAARSVYEKGGIGWGDAIAQARNSLMRSDDPAKKALGLVLNATVPFSKVPDTILTIGVRGLPGINEAVGAYKVASLLRQGEVYAARREAGATALLSAANLAIAAQALQGNITGDGPDDPTLLSQMMAARDENGNALWRPHSVRLPDGRWIDYGFLGPMEIHMAGIANVVEGMREEGNKLNPQMPQMVVNRLTKTVGNLWYLRGLSDVLSAISSGQLASPNMANAIEALGDRFVWQSGLLNEIRQLTDPTVREPGLNPLAREANRVPGLEALVQPRIDPTTGQPLQRPQDVLSLVSRGSPPGMSPGTGTAEILSRSDVAVSPAPKQITVGRFPIALTLDEQRQYTELRGQLLDQMVAPLARDNAFRTAPQYVRDQVLRRLVDQASSAASRMLVGQLDPNSLNQRLQQSQTLRFTNTPFLPEEEPPATGRVPALAR